MRQRRRRQHRVRRPGSSSRGVAPEPRGSRRGDNRAARPRRAVPWRGPPPDRSQSSKHTARSWASCQSVERRSHEAKRTLCSCASASVARSARESSIRGSPRLAPMSPRRSTVRRGPRPDAGARRGGRRWPGHSRAAVCRARERRSFAHRPAPRVQVRRHRSRRSAPRARRAWRRPAARLQARRGSSVATASSSGGRSGASGRIASK